MYKKITIIFLILFSFIFFGCGLFENESDAEKLMKYVDCDEFYVGSYGGWIQMDPLDSELLKGYENARRLGYGTDIPFQDLYKRQPLFIFVDKDRNITINDDLKGKVNTDGSFEIENQNVRFSGQFSVDKDTLNVSAAGTSENLISVGHFSLPSSFWRASYFEISMECYIAEEIVYDFSDEEDVQKGIDSKENVVKITDGKKEILLKPNTQIKYHKTGEDAMMSDFRGQLRAKTDQIPEGAKFEVSTIVAIIGVRGTTFSINTTAERTIVFVEEGEVEVTSIDGKEKISLTDGDMVIIFDDEFPEEPFNLYKEKSFLEKMGINLF